MTYPTAYDPAVNFASEEAASTAGRSTVRTIALDAELTAISTRVGQIISCITAITRSDAALLDGVVTIASLSTAVQAYLTAAGGAIRGAWLTATVYVAKDVVTEGTGTYICAVAHTSGTFATDLAAVKWVKLYDTSGFAASAVTFTPTGSISASNVQAAIAEVDSEKLAKASNLSDLASRVTSFVNLVAPGGTMSGHLTFDNCRINEDYASATSATTMDFSAINGNYVNIALGGGAAYLVSSITLASGSEVVAYFASDGVTFAHSASLICPGGQNLVTQAGDTITVRGDPAGARIVGFQRASGVALVPFGLPLLAVAASGNQLTGSVPNQTPLTFNNGVSMVLQSSINHKISNGSTGGTSNGVAARIWWAMMYNSGTPEIAWINTWNGTDVYEILATDTISTTAEGGAGAADSAHVWYSNTARSNQPICILGYCDVTQATAGAWVTQPSLVQCFGPGMPLPGQAIQTRRSADSAVATTTTVMPVDDTIPQNTEGGQLLSKAITARSALNLVDVRANLNLAHATGSTARGGVAVFQDSTANALAARVWQAGGTTSAWPVDIGWRGVVGTASASTFAVRAGPGSAGTVTFNGSSSAREMGGVMASFLEVREIMR